MVHEGGAGDRALGHAPYGLHILELADPEPHGQRKVGEETQCSYALRQFIGDAGVPARDPCARNHVDETPPHGKDPRGS